MDNVEDIYACISMSRGINLYIALQTKIGKISDFFVMNREDP